VSVASVFLSFPSQLFSLCAIIVGVLDSVVGGVLVRVPWKGSVGCCRGLTQFACSVFDAEASVFVRGLPCSGADHGASS
jgi:hypothetical protein